VSELLEKVAWINLLNDFYGQLLTQRQQDFMELYYGQNLSLGEIAAEFKVTRQAVHDTLKRAEQLLNEYEAKLGLVKKFNNERDKLATVALLLDEHISKCSDHGVLRAREILSEILDMVNN
jgi:predicted DNA-binding protein YlxM (UPF0122 family)